jgi:hypothetical protein
VANSKKPSRDNPLEKLRLTGTLPLSGVRA